MHGVIVQSGHEKGFVTKEVKAVLSSRENNKGRAGSLLKVKGGCEVLRVVGEEKRALSEK
jgi:hypothetical protein